MSAATQNSSEVEIDTSNGNNHENVHENLTDISLKGRNEEPTDHISNETTNNITTDTNMNLTTELDTDVNMIMEPDSSLSMIANNMNILSKNDQNNNSNNNSNYNENTSISNIDSNTTSEVINSKEQFDPIDKIHTVNDTQAFAILKMEPENQNANKQESTNDHNNNNNNTDLSQINSIENIESINKVQPVNDIPTDVSNKTTDEILSLNDKANNDNISIDQQETITDDKSKNVIDNEENNNNTIATVTEIGTGMSIHSSIEHPIVSIQESTINNNNNNIESHETLLTDRSIPNENIISTVTGNIEPKNEEETETVQLHSSPADLKLKQQPIHESLKQLDIKENQDLKLNEKTIKEEEEQQIQAYAMLDFDSFTFYVQTMQILLGRMVEGDSSTDSLDIHLGNQKAISRKHAKIFYNFGTQRFELSVLGRNGAFVDGNFVERGITVPLNDGTKIQIGETEFVFVLPRKEPINSDKIIEKKLSKEEKKKAQKLNKKSKVNSQTDEPKKSAKQIKPRSKSTVHHLETIDNLVANFDDLNKNIQNDIKLESDELNMIYNTADKQTEIDIEKEIGKVLERESKENELNTSDTTGKLKKKSTKKAPKSTDPSKVKPKRQPKAKKKVYTLEEIPEQYRAKPNLPYSILITDCLRSRGTERGMSLSEIYKGIQELYPYYFYCPDGWQSSVRHNLSLNKSFRKISKEGKGWLWGVNEEVIAEKDRARQKQLENAKSKTPKSSTKSSTKLQLHNPINSSSTNINIAPNGPNFSLRSIPQAAPQNTSNKPIQHSSKSESLNTTTRAENKPTSNKTNKADNKSNNNSNISANTKRALAYLQKELIQLTKTRKMYDRATSTEILTKALAMTISQVDQAAKNFSIKGFPLVTLIDKNPGHVTKILTAALNAATLQICKQKGLTPHLPPKTPSQSTTRDSTPAQTEQKTSFTQNTQQTASSSNSVPDVPTPIKKQNNIQILPKLEKSSTPAPPIFHKATMDNVNQRPKTPTALTSLPGSTAPLPPKPSTGPVVYQFSKLNSNKSTSSSPKPAFKPAVKLISGASVKSITQRSNSNNLGTDVNQISNCINKNEEKPTNMNSNTSPATIMKPQFYNKAKNMNTNFTLSPSNNDLCNSTQDIDNNEKKLENDQFKRDSSTTTSISTESKDSKTQMAAQFSESQPTVDTVVDCTETNQEYMTQGLKPPTNINKVDTFETVDANKQKHNSVNNGNSTIENVGNVISSSDLETKKEKEETAKSEVERAIIAKPTDSLQSNINQENIRTIGNTDNTVVTQPIPNDSEVNNGNVTESNENIAAKEVTKGNFIEEKNVSVEKKEDDEDEEDEGNEEEDAFELDMMLADLENDEGGDEDDEDEEEEKNKGNVNKKSVTFIETNSTKRDSEQAELEDKGEDKKVKVE